MLSWRYWFNLMILGLSLLLVVFLAGALYLSRQAALTYLHPVRSARPACEIPDRWGVAYQDVEITSFDGTRLVAWYTPSRNGAVILAAHGYSGWRSGEMHALFARNGYGVLSWDARAHGESGGDVSTVGYYESRDLEVVLDWARAQPGVERVGVWGGSMGAVSSLLAAARRPELAAVVADSAFTSLADQLDQTVYISALRAPIRFFAEQEAGVSLDAVRPIDAVGRISPRPVLLIHGLADDVIPLHSGERLYAAAREPKTLWTEPDAGHVTMYNAHPEDYERRVIAFFDGALLSAGQ